MTGYQQWWLPTAQRHDGRRLWLLMAKTPYRPYATAIRHEWRETPA